MESKDLKIGNYYRLVPFSEKDGLKDALKLIKK